MAKRSPREQRTHDARVRSEAQKLERKGWDVQADLRGHDRPDPIGKKARIPDVVATKRGTTKIIEVETPDTVEKDAKQHATFRRSAGQKPRSSFEVKVTRKKR